MKFSEFLSKQIEKKKSKVACYSPAVIGAVTRCHMLLTLHPTLKTSITKMILIKGIIKTTIIVEILAFPNELINNSCI